MRSDRPDEPIKRFAETFAKRPVVPRITRLPGARAWATTLVTAVAVAAVAITVPMLGRIGGGSNNQTTVAVGTPITSGNAAKPNGTGTGGKTPESGPTTTPPPIVKPGSTIQRPGVTVTAPPAAVTKGAPLPPGQKPPAVNTGTTTGTTNTGTTNAGTTNTGSGTASGASPKAPPPATTTTSQPQVQVQSAPQGTGVRLQGYGSNRCADVKDLQSGTAKDGSPLQLWDCANTANQKWAFTNGTVQSMGMCMDLAWASTNDGTQVQLVKCNGGWAQKFTLNSAHDLVNPTADKCVTAEGTGNGARLVLRSCNGSSAQKWRKI